MATKWKKKQSFTVPVTASNYAPEEVILGRSSQSETVDGSTDAMGVGINIVAVVATAVLELWLLDIGSPGTLADPNVAANWTYSGMSVPASATGYTGFPSLVSWPGVKIRVKSGGTAGTVTANIVAD